MAQIKDDDFAKIPDNGGSYVGKTYQEILDDRDFLVTDKVYADDEYYEKPTMQKTFNKEGVEGIFVKTPLNYLFFHKQNIQKIQNKLRYNIWVMTKNQVVISEQKESEIFIVMRSIFLRYSKHLPIELTDQIRELNNIVVDTIVPKLLTNVKAHMKYLEDINQPYKIMERPRNTSSSGMKTLRTDMQLGFGNNPEELKFDNFLQ